jgi:hypothetical protein
MGLDTNVELSPDGGNMVEIPQLNIITPIPFFNETDFNETRDQVWMKLVFSLLYEFLSL